MRQGYMKRQGKEIESVKTYDMVTSAEMMEYIAQRSSRDIKSLMAIHHISD